MRIHKALALLLAGSLAVAGSARASFDKTAAGIEHACAVTSAGSVQCWGDNSFGQLGNGGTAAQAAPVAVTELDDVVELAAGSFHTCALTSVGGVKCWGRNDQGQLGDGTTRDANRPLPVPGLEAGVTALHAGAGHTCAITRTGAAQCWGRNDFGQIGDGTTTRAERPVTVPGLETGVTAMATGYFHTCAVADGVTRCWGHNGLGQLGDGSGSNRLQPTEVAGLNGGVTDLAAGYLHTCAVTRDSGLSCWGYNFFGQLGANGHGNASVPHRVAALPEGVTGVAAGYADTCALSQGTVVCWGRKQVGAAVGVTTSDRLARAPTLPAHVVASLTR